jgi:AraC-like DNA-binding protein
VVGELAKQALVETDLKISQVAMQLGYSEVSGFNHAFARLVGQSPRQYRRLFRQP